MLAVRFGLAWDETSTEATDSDADGAIESGPGKASRRIAADLGVGVGTVLRITGPFAAVAAVE
jgi:hypothetical protein